MKKILVGYTGFVGSNLLKQTEFSGLYNSKNVIEAYNTRPEFLVYCGVRAEKFLANKDPERDYQHILESIKNIEKISPKKIILISTIDVYKNPTNVNEDTEIDTNGLNSYGLNRYKLEKWIEENFSDYLIIRLPGLYGDNLKKNFIYDMINLVPSMLTEDKFLQLIKDWDELSQYYENQNNGFYKCRDLNKEEKLKLKSFFKEKCFTALNFTDSRACFQFYNLRFLWNHIETILNEGIKKINITTEPINAAELYKYITGETFINEISNCPPYYNVKTKYFFLFKGKNGYIFERNFLFSDIKSFYIYSLYKEKL